MPASGATSLRVQASRVAGNQVRVRLTPRISAQ